ncbi:MAG TPA: gfo/Idh/MocA family oxidoreductase, partial [Verrucomicrobiae bacterium]|nr:gfo/Idh/MocA family oxidoreductase [Verrucomicrobiae bacterium]
MKTTSFKPIRSTPLRRRTFLKGVLATGAASVFAPRLLLAAGSTDKFKLACIGIGNRGADDIKELNRTGLAQIVALCDMDMGAPHTQEILKLFPDVPRFQDFRQMFDK